MTKFHAHHTNELLGYPADARLLIVNADDFGMCHAINQGIYKSLQEGIVTSTSLMVPCPWASHAMSLLKENPSIHFAVHLPVLCDTILYPWGRSVRRKKYRHCWISPASSIPMIAWRNFWLGPLCAR